ncbi:hypothetical protein ACIBO2_02335 [Nonomuraea sp. NPDC050022]|uniref:hypothetical protein n=1 Tax=Nonomuraea sp. NPDC050022 TaxID=3364358 RepID=UPI0037921A4A
MSGETTITIIGNLTSDPELRFTQVSREFANSEARVRLNRRVYALVEPIHFPWVPELKGRRFDGSL